MIDLGSGISSRCVSSAGVTVNWASTAARPASDCIVPKRPPVNNGKHMLDMSHLYVRIEEYETTLTVTIFSNRFQHFIATLECWLLE